MKCCVCGHERFEHNSTIGGGTSCFITECGCQQFVPVPSFSDPINPEHYKQGAVECIDAIREAVKILIELGHGIELKLDGKPAHYMTKVKEGRISQPKLVYLYDTFSVIEEFETVDELIAYAVKIGRIPN